MARRYSQSFREFTGRRSPESGPVPQLAVAHGARAPARLGHELFMPETHALGSGSEAIACTTEIGRFLTSLISRTSRMISDIFSHVSGRSRPRNRSRSSH